MTHDPILETIIRNLLAKRDYHIAEAQKFDVAVEALQALGEPVNMKGSVLERGFDRATIRNKVLGLKVGYPLSPSYTGNAGAANLARQAVCSAVQAHPRLPEWLTSNNIKSLSNEYRNHQKLWEACKFLGLDYGTIKQEARIIHEEIMRHGEPGIDFVEHVR